MSSQQLLADSSPASSLYDYPSPSTPPTEETNMSIPARIRSLIAKMKSNMENKKRNKPRRMLWIGIALSIVLIVAAGITFGVLSLRKHNKKSSFGGSLSVNKNTPEFTINYTTKTPSSTNWIAIYHAVDGGPDEQKENWQSLTWVYAPGETGTVEIPVTTLPPGFTYKAYYLQDDGFKWLADPIEVFLPGKGPLRFIVDKFSTQNARRGDAFIARIGGLLANPADSNTKFVKLNTTDNASWIQVSSDGAITGTPTSASPNTSRVTIEATGSDGTKARLEVTIPVISSSSQTVSELTVMSYNMWFGGVKVNDFHNKQIRFLNSMNVDVVGLQESWGGQGVRLAQTLGWHYWQGHELGILSRYPIVDTYPVTESGGAVRIALDNENQVNVWNSHLGHDPYGPYDFCFYNMTKSEVIDREAKSGRTRQIIEIVEAMKDHIANSDKIPVLLTGDFNAPSQLDWTEANKDAHCGTGDFLWPSSNYPINAGLIDSYREMHKDPKTEPGFTWSPVYVDNVDEGKPEPKDRIDFIFHKGLKVLESYTHVTGKPQFEPNQADNEWTSDHAVVVSVFSVAK